MEPGPYACLDVSDTGSGIGPDQLEHVFSPVFAAQGTHGARPGLASALGTVSQSGGDLQVTSQLGVGSTFTVLLPEVEVSAPSASDTYERARLHPSQAHRVLVVDEDDLVRDLAHDYLTALGYRVETAASGSAALDLIQVDEAGPFDAIVSDVVMPDLSGREIVAGARAHHPGCQVVYTSGYSRESVLDGKLLEQGEKFLQKPVRLAALASLLKEHLG